MKLHDAHVLALQLLEQHQLWDWAFAFDRAKTRFGCCQYGKKIITLSKHLVEHNDEEQVRDTILHEIAHALVGPRHGHGSIWKLKATELGCRARSCCSREVVLPPKKYTVSCPHCQKSLGAHKKRKIACHSCCKKYNRGYYSERFRMVFVENSGKPQISS